MRDGFPPFLYGAVSNLLPPSALWQQADEPPASQCACVDPQQQQQQAVQIVSEKRILDPFATMECNTAFPMQYVFRYLGLEERLRIGEVGSLLLSHAVLPPPPIHV